MEISNIKSYSRDSKQVPVQALWTVFGIIWFVLSLFFLVFYIFERFLTLVPGSGLNRAQTAMPWSAPPCWTSSHTWRKPKHVTPPSPAAPEPSLQLEPLSPSHAVSHKFPHASDLDFWFRSQLKHQRLLRGEPVSRKA